MGKPARPARPMNTDDPTGCPEPRPTRSATLGAPTSAAAIPAGAVESPARSAAVIPANDPVNDLLTRRSAYNRDGPPPGGERPSWKFGEKMEGMLGQREEWFK